MSDSNEHERLGAKHEGEWERRIEVIKRWVEYIESEPPEAWGPQQNTIVNDQLDAARNVQMSASDRQHVSDVAREIVEERDSSDDSVE